MRESPRDYGREFTTPVSFRVRRRIGYSHERGAVTRFVVQLEYRIDGGWYVVVRFDHDPASQHGHDVTEDGVHMDIYREGTKARTDEIYPPMAASDALTLAEEHLNRHAEQYVERFESWHGIGRR